MKTQAIFLGARQLAYEERTNSDGVKLPAFKGWQYSFYSNDWYKDLVLTGNGLFTNMTLSLEEEQPKHLKVGDMVEINITNLDSRKCVLSEASEDTVLDIPY